VIGVDQEQGKGNSRKVEKPSKYHQRIANDRRDRAGRKKSSGRGIKWPDFHPGKGS
jgi:hypothetical protein